MNKKWKILGIVSLVLIAFLTGISFIIFQVVKFINVEELTKDEFKIKMEELDFSVTDTTDDYSDYNNIESVQIATNKDENYTIEFYIFSSDSEAISFYNYNQSIIESTKGNISGTNNINAGNHSKYTLSSNGKYNVLIRVKNTILYVTADKKYKNEIKKTINRIKY